MSKKYLVLSDNDFGRPIDLSRSTDLVDSLAEADVMAEDSVRGGSRLTYVFELRRVYIPEGSTRMVEVCQVELVETKQQSRCNYGGTSDE